MNPLEIESMAFIDGTPAAEDQPAENIQREIVRIEYKMGLLAQGDDFLALNGAPPEYLEKYLSARHEAIAKAAAKVLHIEDYKTLLIKANRTKEQEKVMGEIAGREAVNRLKTYLLSNYHSAHELLIADFAGALKVGLDALEKREDWEDISAAISFLAKYYFAIHKELNPAAAAALSADQKEELSGLAQKLTTYRAKHGGGFFENISPCFRLDGVTAAQPEYRQTEISQTREFGFPTSLIWQKQREIATLGLRGGAYDVSKRGSIDPIWVEAKITDREGKPIDIDGIRKGAQRAIGNLIDQARAEGLTELTAEYTLNPPVSITVEQVYRRWAGLDSSANVTFQQVAEMEAAIDSLTSAPSQINFKAQLEQHKKMKKQTDYDYNSPTAGGLEENLIMARKRWIVTRNGERVSGYQIFTYPMFYFYSHIVGQITQTKRELLTGGEKPKEKQQNEAQNNSRDVAMRNHVALRIERMRKDNSLSHKVLLSEIADDEGFTLTRQTERTLLKNLDQYLTRLQGSHEIKSYSPLMGGRGNRKLVGYEIAI